MTSTYARPVPARLPPAKLPGAHVELACALALLPVVRIWDLTDDLNTSVTTAALFAAAAWLIWQLTPDRLPRASFAARLTGGLLLAAGAWQLAWIDGNDFWFFRVCFVLWSAAWLLLWWGWTGLIRGWRVLAAFAVWAVWCDGPWRWMRDALQSGDRFGPQLARVTARCSGLVFTVLGMHPTVTDNLLSVHGRSVTVGVPCTGLPLAKLLLLLLALAVLLFRVPAVRALALAVAAVGIAFVVSVLRVVLLAWFARNPERFQFWHDPGSGGQWFTAAAMALLALLFYRALPAPQPLSWPGGAVPVPGGARWIAIGGVLMLFAARFTAPVPPQVVFTAAPAPGFQVASDSSEPIDLGPGGGTHANEPAWIRRIVCTSSAERARLELTLAYVPQMLAGDLRPEAGAWSLSGDGRVAVLHGENNRTVWVTTLAPDGSAFASADGWARKIDAEISQPSRWLAWLAHRRPLRDKRAYWAEAEWTGAGPAPATPPAPFRDWLAGAGAPHGA